MWIGGATLRAGVIRCGRRKEETIIAVVKAKPIRIAIEDDNGNYRSLTKIIPYPDGGFAVLTPYHTAKEGFLFKLQIAEELRGKIRVPSPAEGHRYSARDRVKLSFHPDGFVQFSGENPRRIMSGRDESGRPKGLGIVRAPLSQPIVTGPTFGILAWGLSDFEKCRDSERNVLRFSRADLYYGRGSTTMTEPNGICIDAVVFPSAFWAEVRGEPPDLRLRVALSELVSGLATVDVRIVPLENPDVFLGIFASHLAVRFPPPSGFQLCSPGDQDHYRMYAIYPNFGDFVTTRNLDFAPTDARS